MRACALPVVHYVGDDGGKQAEQHDRCAGVHHRVQELSRIRRKRQHLLQILTHTQRERESASDTQTLSYQSNTDTELPQQQRC